MDFFSLLVIAVALSMDAFSVSVCKGLASKRFSIKTAVICGLWFGGFQALMPLIGYFLGAQFEHFITNFDHWIAFALLAFIGANMIREAQKSSEECPTDNSLQFHSMLLLAIATSIDALAVGITFAFLKDNIWTSILVIGLTTFVFSFIGVRIGNIFGSRWSKTAGIVGGVILILIGTKILLEHLGYI